VELYSGPEYMIHYRFSTIMLHVAISFVYGAAMPLLYPIACLALLVLYINERLLVCYYYREPPAFDESLTLKCLQYLSYVTLLSLPVNFWMLGNRQIFENFLIDIKTNSDIQSSGHTISYALDIE